MAVPSPLPHGHGAVEQGFTQATGERGRGLLLAELASGLAAIFEGALVLNEGMRVVAANAMASELLGFETAAELVGRTLDDIAEEVGLPPLASRIFEERRLTGEFAVEAPTERFLELRATITPSGRVVLVVRDITYERRRRWADATFAALAKVLAESTTYAQALHRLLGALGTALEWSAAELHQVDRERGMLRFEASWYQAPYCSPYCCSRGGMFAAYDCGSPGNQGILTTAWATCRPVWLEDLSDDPCLQCRSLTTENRCKSALAYPVPVGGEIVGVLVFFSERRRKCDPDIICLLTALDPVIGQFLERLRLFEAQNQLLMERERGLDRLKVLHSVTTALAEAVTIEEVGRVVLSASIEAANASSTVLYLLDPDRNELWLVDSIGSIRPEHQRFRVTEVKGPLIDAIVERRPILVQNRAEMAARYPDLYKAIGSDFETWIALPCIAHDRVIGGMGLNFRHVQKFSDDDLAFYDTLAYQCALALDRARLFEAEHRAKEEALAERERFHSILMSAPIPVVVHEGPDHVVTMVNEAYLGILRRAGEYENIIGKPLREASSIMRDVFAQVATELDRVYESGQALNVPEYPVLLPTPDGKTEVHYLAASAQPLRDAQGNVTGIVQLLVDITDQVLARKRQEAARAEAEAETRAKDQFLAMLSHELRTPLQAILGWTQLLLSRPCDPKTLRRGLETIERNTRQQVRLIEQLLDVSRIVAGKLSVEPRPLDLAELVETSVESLRTEAQQKRIALTADCEHPLPVLGDPERLRQVVFNLVGNALKFTPAGGRVTVTVERRGSNAILAVQDTGQGIPPDKLPHIFQPFRQLEAKGPRPRDGLGLGLAIVRHLAELHGGTVRAESEGEGRGATFTVTLPVLEGGDVTVRREPSPTDELREELQGTRVLLIDDDTDTAEVIALALSQFGVDVNVATSADEAIEQFRERCCDIIISDLAIGDTDGFEIMRRLRRMEAGLARRRSPAIALTGMATREDYEKALQAGYDAHLAKPIAPDDLVRIISEVVRRRREGTLRPAKEEDAKKP